MATQQKIEVTVVDKTARSLSNISRRLTNLNKGLLGINRVAGLAATALAGIGGGITLRRIVRVSAEFQDLRTTLTSVTGSAENGAKAFDFLTNFATRTQFSTQDLTTAFIKLKTAGIEPTEKLLTTFTDAAAVTTDQLGTLQAITDLFARTTAGGLGLEEINRLTDRGLPALDILQEKLGLNRQQISEFGKSAEGARIITEKLAEGINERFGGATAARLNNLSVQFSNLSIAIDNAADKVGRGGLNAALGDLTSRLTETITKNDQLAAELGNKLARATILLGDALEFAIKNIDTLGIAFLGFIGLKITLSVLSLASAFGGYLFKGIGLAILAMRKLRIAAAATKVSLATLLGPISLIVYGLTELATSSDWVKKKFGVMEDGVDSTNDKLDDNASFLDKVNNAMKETLGIDAKGYWKGVGDRLDGLNKNQEELNEKTKKYNELKANGSVIDQEEIDRLKAKPKSFEEILAAQNKILNDAKVGLETDYVKQGLLKAELDMGKQLSELQERTLTTQLKATKAKMEEAAQIKKIEDAATSLFKKTDTHRQKELEILEKGKDRAIEIEKEKLDAKEISLIEYNERKLEIEKAYNDEVVKMNKEALDKADSDYMASIERRLRESQNATGSILTDKDREFLKRKGLEEDAENLAREQLENHKKFEKNRVYFTISSLGESMKAIGQHNKKAFEAYKAFAISQTIMDTYSSAVAAFKALAGLPIVGPVLGTAAAAAAIATGMARVSSIRSQQYTGPRAQGGPVGANQSYLVGEKGPEILRMGSNAGSIVPNDQMGGGPVTVNFNISTVDAEGFDELLIRRRATITGIINTALEKRGKVGVTG
jgi:phage tail tape-measure protein